MKSVNITTLRSHLPAYLAKVHKGTEIQITSRGHIVARLLPPVNTQATAMDKLKELRKHCKIGDVVSPISESWDAEK